MKENELLEGLAARQEEIWQELLNAGVGAYLEESPALLPGGGGKDTGAELGHRLVEALRAIGARLEQHLREEEASLVLRLAPTLGYRVGPLASMLQEHRQIHSAMAKILEGAYPNQPAELKKLLLLLDDHLRKERYIIFPLAREIHYM